MLKKINQKFKQEAHHLKPVIIIGVKGLSDAVHKEIDLALNAHELIKIRIREHDKEAIKEMLPIIVDTHQAHLVQTVGHTLTLFRKNEKT